MIIAATLWWTPADQQLLAMKLAEGQAVDHWRIVQATHSFRGLPRPITTPIERPDLDWRTVEFTDEELRGRGRKACARRNGIQRDATLPADLMDDDIFVFSDLDEIVQAGDWQKVVAAARSHGLVRLTMRRYYGKINRQAARPWSNAFAFTGAWWRTVGRPGLDSIRVGVVRRQQGVAIDIQGQHFCWLFTDEADIDRKMSNHAHPENDRPAARRHLLSLRGPAGQPTRQVPVDGSYPAEILRHPGTWMPYMA